MHQAMGAAAACNKNFNIFLNLVVGQVVVGCPRRLSSAARSAAGVKKQFLWCQLQAVIYTNSRSAPNSGFLTAALVRNGINVVPREPRLGWAALPSAIRRRCR